MQAHVLKFSKRLSAAALTLAGLIAAATAHADPGKALSAAPPLALREPLRQCTDVDAILARLQYPAGTTFLLTDAGFVALKQPKAVKVRAPEPEPEAWGNSGG